MRPNPIAVVLLLAALIGCDMQPKLRTSPHPILTRIEASEVKPAPLVEATTEPATNEFTGQVVSVADGDTIDVLLADKTTVRVGFNGIDAPERGQPFGNNAKQFVSDAFHASPDVRVVDLGQDRYGRTIGEVYAGGERLGVALVTAGLAWHYVQYAPDDETLAEAERDARDAVHGLWSDLRHVATWDWRKLSKKERDKLR